MFADQTMVVAVPARQSRRDVKKDQASTTMSHREIDTAHRTNQTVAVELGADDGESDPPIQLKRFFLLLRSTPDEFERTPTLQPVEKK